MPCQLIQIAIVTLMLVLLLYTSAFLAMYSTTEAHPTMRRDDDFTADIRSSERHADANATEYQVAHDRHTTAEQAVDPSQK